MTELPKHIILLICSLIICVTNNGQSNDSTFVTFNHGLDTSINVDNSKKQYLISNEFDNLIKDHFYEVRVAYSFTGEEEVLKSIGFDILHLDKKCKKKQIKTQRRDVSYVTLSDVILNNREFRFNYGSNFEENHLVIFVDEELVNVESFNLRIVSIQIVDITSQFSDDIIQNGDFEFCSKYTSLSINPLVFKDSETFGYLNDWARTIQDIDFCDEQEETKVIDVNNLNLDTFKPIYNTTLGTPDVVNLSMSNRTKLFPKAYSGSNYARIILDTKGRDAHYPEHLVAKLESNLISGNKYKLSFAYCVPKFNEHTNNTLGFLFADCLFSYTYGGVSRRGEYEKPTSLVSVEVIENFEWKVFEYEFIADGTESFLVIGAFNYRPKFKDVKSEIGVRDPRISFFIDDVKLVSIN